MTHWNGILCPRSRERYGGLTGMVYYAPGVGGIWRTHLNGILCPRGRERWRTHWNGILYPRGRGDMETLNDYMLHLRVP